MTLQEDGPSFNAPSFKVSNPIFQRVSGFAGSALLQESENIFLVSCAFFHKTTFHVNKKQLLYDKSLFVICGE